MPPLSDVLRDLYLFAISIDISLFARISYFDV
ncbi:hypothetical protein L682_03295 [Aquipseudomonas alcaligenes OT 69]|nr:hypothetical protein L682_03295 [Pseudomonas alcaligenes OT 69]